MPQPNPELFERLINEVRNRECLFLPSHPLYKDRQNIQAEWTAIGEVLGISAEEAKKTWQNLRSSYSRCLAGGKSPGKPWYLRKQMDFLYPYMNLVPNGSAGCSEELSFPGELDTDRTAAMIGQDIKPTLYSIRQSMTKKRKLASPSRVNGTMGANFHLSRRIAEDADEDLVFFKGLLPTVRELSKANKRRFKRVVSNFLFDVLEAQETNTDQMPEMHQTPEIHRTPEAHQMPDTPQIHDTQTNSSLTD